MPKKFADANFRNFEFNESDGVPKEYGVTCYHWAKGKYAENCLLLCGNIGNGKTHLAISAMKEVFAIRTGQSLFIPSGELFEQLVFSTFNHDNKVESIKSLVHLYDCLCIDWLERRHFTEASIENLYLLINRVYLENSKLIITTNLAAEVFKELDERIYSRLHEMSIILPFKWDDYRMQKKIAHS
ncbi:MAG: ATP-binding protein [Clostridiales bacterium]